MFGRRRGLGEQARHGMALTAVDELGTGGRGALVGGLGASLVGATVEWIE